VEPDGPASTLTQRFDLRNFFFGSGPGVEFATQIKAMNNRLRQLPDAAVAEIPIPTNLRRPLLFSL
jgi:hypothetical protein